MEFGQFSRSKPWNFANWPTEFGKFFAENWALLTRHAKVELVRHFLAWKVRSQTDGQYFRVIMMTCLSVVCVGTSCMQWCVTAASLCRLGTTYHTSAHRRDMPTHPTYPTARHQAWIRSQVTKRSRRGYTAMTMLWWLCLNVK